jgi:hypothetical protein
MNFKKLIIPAIMVTIGLIGCSSHYTAPVAVNAPLPPAAATTVPVTPVVVDPVPPSDPLLVSGDGWSLRLPDDNWESVDKDNLPAAEILAMLQNPKLTARGMFLSYSFNGPPANFPLIVLKSVDKSGGKLVGKANTVTINGNVFVHANTVGGKLHVQVWAMAKNGNGYTLMCGSPTSNPEVATACAQIANSIHID